MSIHKMYLIHKAYITFVNFFALFNKIPNQMAIILKTKTENFMTPHLTQRRKEVK